MPAFIPHGAPVTVTTLWMGAVFVLLTGIYFAIMLAFVQGLVGWLRNDRYRRRLNRATGMVLIGFGIRLAVES